MFSHSMSAAHAAHSVPSRCQTAMAVNDFEMVQTPSRFQASAASSSLFPPPLSAGSPSGTTEILGSRPPTLEQLRSLTALPAGLPSRQSFPSSGKNKKKDRPRLAKEGQTISKFFALDGPRPYPTNGISLEQGITLEMTLTLSAFTTSGTPGVPSTLVLSPALSSFAASSVLTTVFDQYKFEQLEVWLEPADPSQVVNYPQLVTAVDLDDATVPSGIGQLADKAGALAGIGVAGRYHKWKPHTAVAVYSGAFTSFANTPAQWIDVASPNVQHFGYKAYAASQGGAVNYQYTIRAVVSFRAPVIA